MFCTRCGSALDVEAAFCRECGAATRHAGSVPRPVAHDDPGAGVTSLAPNIAGLLAYALGPIGGVIFSIIAPYRRDPFVRFHARQSVILSAVCIILLLSFGILYGGVLDAPGMGESLISMSLLLFFLVWLLMMYSAYRRYVRLLPVIGPLAKRQTPAFEVVGRIALGFTLGLECIWWVNGVQSIAGVFAFPPALADLNFVDGAIKLRCANVGFVLLLLLSAHLFVRNFGKLAPLRKWTIITFVVALGVSIALVQYPASTVYASSKSAPVDGYLYSFMAENSGNVKLAVMNFANGAVYAAVFNFLFLIPLFASRVFGRDSSLEAGSGERNHHVGGPLEI